MNEFTELLEQHIPRLRRYAFALHRANRAGAEDLVQDTLVRAIAKQHLWRPGTNLLGWLFTLMHNQHVNNVRRTVTHDGFSYAVDDFHDTVASVSDTSASLQLRDLERAMAQLCLERREVILLVGLEGMSYEAVAEVVGIPIGTVRSRLSRGRLELRQLMGIEEPPAPARLSRAALPAAMAA